MDDLRCSTGLDRLALKTAFRHGLKLIGGAASFAMATRVNPTTLSNYHNASMPDAHACVDVVLDLEKELGSPIVTAKLASLQGYRLIRVECDEKGQSSVSVDDGNCVLQASVDVTKALALALADGQVCARERKELNKRAEAAVVAIRNMQGKLNDQASSQ